MTLSDEDKPSDAEQRAPIHVANDVTDPNQRTTIGGAVQYGTGVPPHWTIRTVTYTLRLRGSCPGDYTLTFNYKKGPWRQDHDTQYGPIYSTQETVSLKANELFERTYTIPQELGQEIMLDSVTVQKPLGCASCAANSFGSGTWAGSGTGPTRGCVDWYIPLGLDADGRGAGGLVLHQSKIDASTYTLSALQIALNAGGSGRLIKDSNGAPRQILVAQALVDMVTTGAQSYELRFYEHSLAGTPDASGIYSPTGDPYLVWRVENPDASGATTNQLRVTRIAGSDSLVSLIDESQSGTHIFSEAGGLRVSEVTDSVENGLRVETIVTKTADGQVASKKKEYYQTFAWGEERVKEVLDPDGAALTTVWTFGTQPQYGSYRQVTTMTRPDGFVENFGYDGAGRLYSHEVPVWNQGSMTHFSQVTYSDLNGDGLLDCLTTYTDAKFTTNISQSFVVEWGAQPGAIKYRDSFQATGPNATWNTASNLVTHERFSSDGQLLYRLTPDGVLTTRSVATNSDGTMTVTEAQGAPDSTNETVVDGTSTVESYSAKGVVVSHVVTDIATGLVIDSLTTLTTDSLGRATQLLHIDGTIETREYCATCGQMISQSYHGETTSYTYDSLNRLVQETRSAGTTVLSITRYKYDADGRQIQQSRVDPVSGAETVLSSSTYDLAGRLGSQTSLQQGTTTYAYAFGANNTTVTTTTYADGGTRIETQHGDDLMSVRGTAVAPIDYVWTEQQGGYWRETHRLNDDGSYALDREMIDFLGNSDYTEFSDGTRTRRGYYPSGQLAWEADADGVATFFAYDARGRLSVKSVDLNSNGQIDYAGTDRITRTTYEVAARHGITLQRTKTEIWEANGQDSPTLVATSEASVDGLHSWETDRGLTTTTTTAFDGQGGHTVTTVQPDGVTTVQTYIGERLLSTATTASNGTQLAGSTNAYDSIGRLQSVTDIRNGATLFTYDTNDRLATATTPAADGAHTGPGYDPQVTQYTYDVMGRVTAVTQPDATVVNTTYFLTGQVQRTWGSRTYPVAYTYDGQQRMKTLTTWQNFAGNTGQAVTTWNYDNGRGWLTSKVYDDGKSVSYQYTPAGRLHARVWSRGVTTTYGYNTAGDTTSVGYSDSTPAVTLTYDREGRSSTVVDGSGTRTMAYDAASGQLQAESYSAGLLNGYSIGRTFDSLSRLSNLSLTVAGGSSPLQAIDYSYDAGSRLDTVTFGQNTAKYAYAANCSLVASVTFANNLATRLTTSKSYDYLNRLTSISSQSSSGATVAYSYTYNAANQRTRATHEDNTYWAYGYDALGQVTSSKAYLADNTAALGLDYGWTYDDIGNRKTSTTNTQVSTYTVNDLNQYTQRTTPPAVDILGAVAADATVAVTVGTNAGLAQRQGETFYRQAPVTPQSASQSLPVHISAMQTPATNGTVATQSRTVFVPAAPAILSYDADGNLTQDGRFVFTWDGENRLIKVETVSASPEPHLIVQFTYDAEGRRVQKQVTTYPSTGPSPLVVTTRFVYDGWNLLAALNSDGTARQTYSWGLDLSGSIQGAGGVGGLLSLTDAASGTTHFATFDGNGNVGGLVNAVDGTISARYDYNTFGQIVRAEGVMADGNPFRFSTKFEDEEIGLIYYGYRYYQPEFGRWLSRDPMDEQGGVNLYAFVDNNGINGFDLDGLEDAQADFVAKSFINGIPNLGSLKGRVGFDPGTVVSPGFLANARLTTFSAGVRHLVAFNQNPTNDAKDGQYRLYTRVTIKASCCGNGAPKVTISTDKDGGREGPGVSGTINLSGPDVTTVGTTTKVHWKGWGRPANAAEPGMQWVAIRTSRNIWHDITIIVSCKDGKPSFREDALSVSKFPSFRLWQDGKPIDERRQGALSDLWQAQSGNPTFVAP